MPGRESLFSRTYTTETMPARQFEIEQVIRNRSGRAYGDYSATDLRTEFEYGITDALQAALYVNYGYLSAGGAPDDDDPAAESGFTRSRTYLQGFSTELIYRVMSPVLDPIGLAFYFEPEIYFTDPHNGLKYDGTFATEYRVLFQKNFFNDQLILAYNLIAEIEFIRFAGTPGWRGELDFNNELGLSYRIASNWYGGVELRNHNEFGDFSKHEHSIIWAGPALHYRAARAWGTLGVLYQIFGSPNGATDLGAAVAGNRFLRSHESLETTLKIGFPL